MWWYRQIPDIDFPSTRRKCSQVDEKMIMTTKAPKPSPSSPRSHHHTSWEHHQTVPDIETASRELVGSLLLRQDCCRKMQDPSDIPVINLRMKLCKKGPQCEQEMGRLLDTLEVMTSQERVYKCGDYLIRRSSSPKCALDSVSSCDVEDESIDMVCRERMCVSKTMSLRGRAVGVTALLYFLETFWCSQYFPDIY